MATDTRHKAQSGSTSVTRSSSRVPHRRQELRRWEESRESESHAPFGLIRQMQDEVDRWFNRFGVDSRWMSPAAWMSSAAERLGEWMPAVDAFQRGNEFIIRADVPGMSRSDLTVEINDDAVTICGERRHEEKDDRDGFVRSERSYGSFCRVVPLPTGAIPESAKANFNNGVLEVVLQSPSAEARRGRRIDITGHDDTAKKPA